MPGRIYYKRGFSRYFESAEKISASPIGLFQNSQALGNAELEVMSLPG
jgi:hypothetical protein